MAPRLLSLEDVLGPVLTGVRPADPEFVSLGAAIGALAAESIVAPHALPQRTTALVAGYAVCSDDTLGASAHEPMPIMAALKLGAGMLLPAGTNAIAPADLIEESSGFLHILGSVSPGDGVRFEGHDLARGAGVVSAGERVKAQHLAVMETLGLSGIAVRRPTVALAGDGTTRHWLERMLVSVGAIITIPEQAQLQINLHSDLPISLALQPGGGTRLALTKGIAILDCPAQLDGAVAAFFAVILPVMATLGSTITQYQTGVLLRGVRSVIGLSEVALFQTSEDGSAVPLICGAITLEALLEATHVAIVPPDLEGYPAGSKLQMIPIELPL